MSRSRRSRGGDRGQREKRELVWRRIDLHIHTPGSADYQDPDISFLDILRKAEARGADLIAITDHNSVRGYANLWREIEDLELLEVLERLTPAEQRRLEEYRRLLQTIRVLPGFEFTATFGFHILAIFPEGTSIRQMEHMLLELNVPEEKVDLGTGEVGATTDVLRAYELLHEAGALVIPAHVNSTHGVAMQNLPFGGQTKIAFTQSPYIDALEATDLESTSRRSTARFFNGSKPEYPRRMHVIQGSDAHRLNRDPNRETNLGVCDRMTEAQIPEVSFAALKELFRSDHFNRVRPYRPAHDPYDFIRIARSEGETIVQAFHEKLPARRGRQSPILRDVVAFANGNGGTVFVGLSGNPKDAIAGIEDAPAQAKALTDDISRYVTPPITPSIDIHSSDNKQLIIISVQAGNDKPYAITPSTIYVRQEGETAIAERDEIVQLVRSGSAEAVESLPELVPAVTPPVVAAPTPAPTPATEPEQPDQPEQPPRKPSRRRRSPASKEKQAAAATAAEPTVEESAATAEPTPAPVAEIPPPPEPASTEPLDIPYPRTGVEIVDSTERDGVTYHAMRDLRNLKVVHNVTRNSARRLWRYAITQQELHPCKPEDVTWDASGERGYWKAYKPRGGDVRFNLVYRHNGDMHVFYGVTDEGLDDTWRMVVPESARPRQQDEQSNGSEQADPAEHAATQESASESAPESELESESVSEPVPVTVESAETPESTQSE